MVRVSKSSLVTAKYKLTAASSHPSNLEWMILSAESSDESLFLGRALTVTLGSGGIAMYDAIPEMNLVNS